MAFSDLVAAADDAVRTHLGAETVIYTTATQETVEVEGIFDERYVLIDDARAGVEQVTPAVWLKLADLPIDPEEDDPVLVIAGKTYRVRERQRDGEIGASVVLLLHRAE